MYIYIYIYIQVQICKFMSIYLCIYTCIYSEYTFIYICISIYIYMLLFILNYICMHLHRALGRQSHVTAALLPRLTANENMKMTIRDIHVHHDNHINRRCVVKSQSKGGGHITHTLGLYGPGPYGPGPYGPPGTLWAGPLWAGPFWPPLGISPDFT